MVRLWPLLFIMCYLSHDVIVNSVIVESIENDQFPYSFDDASAHTRLLSTSDMLDMEDDGPHIPQPPEVNLLANKGSAKNFIDKIKYENLNTLNFPLNRAVQETTPANYRPRNFLRQNFDKDEKNTHMDGVYQSIMKNALKGFTNFVHNSEDNCRGNHFTRDLNLLINKIPDMYENSPKAVPQLVRQKRDLKKLNRNVAEGLQVAEKLKELPTTQTGESSITRLLEKRSSFMDLPTGYEVEELPPAVLHLNPEDSVERSLEEIKKSPSFNPWGGKRSSQKELFKLLQIFSEPMKYVKRTPFYPWGGKRSSEGDENDRKHLGDDKRGKFYAWGGKRVPDSIDDDDDLEKREQGAGVKKVRFHSWGGKRDGFAQSENVDDEVKRGKFYAWGGKRFDNQYFDVAKKPSSEPQVVLRVPFNAWGGKRSLEPTLNLKDLDRKIHEFANGFDDFQDSSSNI